MTTIKFNADVRSLQIIILLPLTSNKSQHRQ